MIWPTLPALPEIRAIKAITLSLANTSTGPDSSCWWCQYKIQIREHMFKNCLQWKSQQKTLWATVLEEAKKIPGPARGRVCAKIAKLSADEWCS